jgi:hypothetical protein
MERIRLGGVDGKNGIWRISKDERSLGFMPMVIFEF